jgi:hypothetical protein
LNRADLVAGSWVGIELAPVLARAFLSWHSDRPPAEWPGTQADSESLQVASVDCSSTTTSKKVTWLAGGAVSCLPASCATRPCTAAAGAVSRRSRRRGHPPRQRSRGRALRGSTRLYEADLRSATVILARGRRTALLASYYARRTVQACPTVHAVPFFSEEGRARCQWKEVQ